MTDQLENSSRMDRHPLISIGMPVYNGAKTLRKAIRSLLVQTCKDFELIISDNASTDRTAHICQEFCATDSRIRYFRQKQNIGAIGNFEFVLKNSIGEYFMWAAGDDEWEPIFIEKNLQSLYENHKFVASISKVRMASARKKSPKYTGTYSISGSYISRLRAYLKSPMANSRFYGIFRRKQIMHAFFRASFIASDWAVVVNLLKHGEFNEVDHYLMTRSSSGASSQLLTHQLKRMNLSIPQRVFPLLDFTRWLYSNVEFHAFLKCIDLILYLNIFYTAIVVSEYIGLRGEKQMVKY